MKLAQEPHADPMMDTACDNALAAMARAASLELTPRQILTTDDLSVRLAPGTRVYVPYLPNGHYPDTIAASRHLLANDLVPVPHFPARALASRQQADDWLSQLAEAGVRRLMVIAGDTAKVAGPFADSLALLNADLFAGRPFGLGVAGHPEGHPVADESALRDALRIKRDYAAATGTDMWVVTQFAFEADSFLTWLHENGDTIAPLPVYFGIAGPTSLRTLLSYAALCGVGVSARALIRHPETARLLRSWTPDGLVEALAHYRVEHPLSLFQGLHIFPFGGLKRSTKWLNNLASAGLADNDQRQSGGQ
ncbi:MAG: methylenetetrahydrofolate reductase [Marinobacter sp.]|uniref:methylenetetrahydrofolate reductase n=1 Tax=Marinobacter sp. TaxID=50741 RepID=UPI00299E95AD|nr:methylenetetrahydrofolate reductase [Marinobacter sp.]MDX1757507.1 methylenetetrahydrofolate reductase [Marinobacter sp.]